MVFYFTGTGNSLYVAQKIADVLNDKILSISDCLNNNDLLFTFAENERIGFVFPTYFRGVPTIVFDFLGKFKIRNYNKHNYVYAVCSGGGVSGNTLRSFGRKLAGHGIKLNAAFELTMPSNFILFADMLESDKDIAEILDKADSVINNIIGDISENKEICPKYNFRRWAISFISYPFYKYDRSTKPFHVTDTCTGCGICVKHCPCEAIAMQDKRPVWTKSKCTECFKCLHYCPAQTIQYGKNTKTRGRYVNPRIKS